MKNTIVLERRGEAIQHTVVWELFVDHLGTVVRFPGAWMVRSTFDEGGNLIKHQKKEAKQRSETGCFITIFILLSLSDTIQPIPN